MENSIVKIVELNINEIIPNRFQPRRQFDEEEIMELSDSIKKYGVIQPLVVRPTGDKYEIIAGERRYKASVLAGLETVPAIIKNLTDKDSAEIAIIENIQRRNLSAIEEALSYKKVLDMGYLTQEDLASKLGKSQPTIANKIRLLNLSDEVQEALLENKISERHARSLLRLASTEEQNKMLEKIISERLTVRKTDQEIDKIKELESGEIKMSEENSVSAMPSMESMPTFDMFESTELNKATNIEQPAVTAQSEFIMPQVSVEPEPQVSALEVAAPSQPEFTIPQISVTPEPQVSAPEVAAPSQPEFIMPQVPVTPAPQVSAPEVAAPSQPEFTMPQVPVTPAPQVSAPEVAAPSQPEFIMPQVPVTPEPQVSAPEVAAPSQPEFTMPQVSAVDNIAPTMPATSPIIEQPEVTVPPVVEPVQIPQVEVPAPIEPEPTIAETSTPEPIIVTDYSKQYDPVMPQTQQAPQKPEFKEVIDAIRECSNKIEKFGYVIDVEEYDLANLYQVVFKVEK